MVQAQLRARCQRLLVTALVLLCFGAEARTGDRQSGVKSARDRIVGNIRRARTPAPPPPPDPPPPPPPPPARRRSQEAEEDEAFDGAPKFAGERPRTPPLESDRLKPRLLEVLQPAGNQAFPQLTGLPGAGNCNCHHNPFFMFDSDRQDCFDPWHQQTITSCEKMCPCYGEHYVGGFISTMNKCVNLTDAMIRAPNETQRLQQHVGTDADAQVLFELKTGLPSCVEAGLVCMDDPTYRDSHGDSCDFYASLPAPLIACAFPGYRAAITRCPFACGTCDMLLNGWSEGEVVDVDGDGVADVIINDFAHGGYSVELGNPEPEPEPSANRTNTFAVDAPEPEPAASAASGGGNSTDVGGAGTGGSNTGSGGDSDDRQYNGSSSGSSLNEVSLRYFDSVEHFRPTCPTRNNLGAVLKVTRYATRERCARECATLTLSTLDNPEGVKCVAFTYTQVEDKTAGTSSGLSALCEFMSDLECTTDKFMGEEFEYTTYVSKRTSDCDPMPSSPLQLDGCGVCGGDNTSCTASLELIVDSIEPESAAAQAPTLGSVVAPAGSRMYPQRAEHHGPAHPTNTTQLLDATGYRQWSQSQVFAVLELYGSKGHSHDLLQAYGRDNLLFSFGNHPDGTTAEFLLTEPSSEQIGELERVELHVYGGDHWLDGNHGRQFKGIKLMLTMDRQRLLWTFPLLLNDVLTLDQTTSFTWNFGTKGMNLPTAVRQCHPDCTASTAEPDGREDDFEEEDRTPHAFKLETDRDGMRVLTPALRQFPGSFDGCLERCTTTYEIHSPDARQTRGGRDENCAPNPSEVGLCPRLYFPVCSADGKTYRNSCVAHALCAVIHHQGSCGLGRDLTYHFDRQQQRLATMHDQYQPDTDLTDVVPQQGIFGDHIHVSEKRYRGER